MAMIFKNTIIKIYQKSNFKKKLYKFVILNKQPPKLLLVFLMGKTINIKNISF